MNKCAIITGASSKIGQQTAILFAKNGYDLVLHYHQDETTIQKLKKEIEKNYKTSILIVQADLNKEEQITALCNTIVSKLPQIDVIVHNAAIALDSILEMKTEKTFKETFQVNTIAPFLITKHLMKFLKKDASIIFISSTNAIDTYYQESIEYDASKAALISLAHNLATSLAPIRVNTIAPGWVDTKMNETLTDEFKQKEINKILLKRFAKPEEIAKVIYFIASEATYVNDSIIRVDGGVNRC